MESAAAYYHLPGLFEFYELYRRFAAVPGAPGIFYDWCAIGSIYGAPAGTHLGRGTHFQRRGSCAGAGAIAGIQHLRAARPSVTPCCGLSTDPQCNAPCVRKQFAKSWRCAKRH